jgi:hypothetical protein
MGAQIGPKPLVSSSWSWEDLLKFNFVAAGPCHGCILGVSGFTSVASLLFHPGRSITGPSGPQADFDGGWARIRTARTLTAMGRLPKLLLAIR